MTIATTGDGGGFFLPYNFAAVWGKKNIPQNLEKNFFQQFKHFCKV